jgi:hypothetical protein
VSPRHWPLSALSPASLLLAAYRAAVKPGRRAQLASDARAFAASGPRVTRAIVNNTIFTMLALGIAERRDPVEVAYWWAQTISTVGYGDVPPESLVGRGIGVWYMASMVPLVLLAGAHFVGLAIPDLNLFSHAEQEQVKADARTAAREATVNARLLGEIAANLGIDVEAIALDDPRTTPEPHQESDDWVLKA